MLLTLTSSYDGSFSDAFCAYGLQSYDVFFSYRKAFLMF